MPILTSTLREWKDALTRWKKIKDEYDLSQRKSGKNPHASQLKKPVTIRLSDDVVDYLKGTAHETGLPYQSLVNL